MAWGAVEGERRGCWGWGVGLGVGIEVYGNEVRDTGSVLMKVVHRDDGSARGLIIHARDAHLRAHGLQRP